MSKILPLKLSTKISDSTLSKKNSTQTYAPQNSLGYVKDIANYVLHHDDIEAQQEHDHVSNHRQTMHGLSTLVPFPFDVFNTHTPCLCISQLGVNVVRS